MTKSKGSSYIRFLNFIDALDAKSGVKKLDDIEEQLLNIIMRSFAQEREILVGELLVLDTIGSQATLHGRIVNLRKLGFVDLVVDVTDGRKKKVAPTKLAIKHYESLSKLLSQAAAT